MFLCGQQSSPRCCWPADWWIPSSVVRLRASYEGAGRGPVEKAVASLKSKQYTYNADPNKENYAPGKEYSTLERARIYGLAQYAVATGNLLLNNLFKFNSILP